MNDLEKLHIQYKKGKEKCAQCSLDVQKKTEEINNIKIEITETKPKLTEIERSLNNVRKGIGMSLSTDEFIALKDELAVKRNRLQELNELLPMQEQSLRSLNNYSMSLGSSVRTISNQMAGIIADKASVDVAIAANDKLKHLTYTVLSQHGCNFRGRAEDYDILYKQIGEKLCNKLFATDTDSVNLPTIQQAISERDLLIENIA